MDLSHIAATKLGAGNNLYEALKAASPDASFTRADSIHVQFKTPDMKIPSGPNHEAEARANGETIEAAAERGKKALETIDGLTINNYFPGLASAMVSGPASAIAAMLELPEVEGAVSFKGVTFVAAADRGR